MKKFMVIYYAPEEANKKMASASPEEMKEGMKPWMVWAEKCGDALVDMGSPLGNGVKVTPEGQARSDKEVAGYSILQADSMDAAKALIDGHPHLAWNAACEIEVYEMLPLPGA